MGRASNRKWAKRARFAMSGASWPWLEFNRRKMSRAIARLGAVSLFILLASPAAAYDAYGFQFDAGNLSHCYVYNVSNVPMVKGCMVQGMRDLSNPVDLGHGVSRLLQPGESQEITYAVRTDVCGPVQIDGLDNLQPGQTGIAQWTESDIHNNHVSALGQYLQFSVCAAPPNTPPPPPPGCQVITAQYRGFPGYDWLATSAPWYPDVRGPYVLPAVMAAGGLWSQMMITGDDYHVSDPDYTPWQAHEQVRIYYWPSGLVSGPTDDVPSDVLSVKSYMGVINLPPGQTHFYVLHAGPINLDANGQPIPSDSVKPVWATWQSLCPQVGGQ